MYRFYNANSHGNRISDCTIRSISLATHRTWNETYKELSNEARKQGLMMDSIEFIENYLDKRYKRACYGQMTLGEFAREHPYGTYLVTMAGHITCVKGNGKVGVVYDTFDPSNRFIWCSWRVE